MYIYLTVIDAFQNTSNMTIQRLKVGQNVCCRISNVVGISVNYESLCISLIYMG